MRIVNDTLYDRLYEIDAVIADIYKGAVEVINNTNNPDKISQSANSMRELLRRIVDKYNEEQGIKKNPRQRKENEKEESFVEIMEMSIDPISSNSDFTRLLHHLNNSNQFFVTLAHHGKIVSENDYLKKLESFENELLYFTQDYRLSLQKINTFLKEPNHTSADFQLLKTELKTNSLRKYFFEQAPIDWLEMLLKNGFFENPPKKIAKTKSMPYWWQSKYLLRALELHDQNINTMIVSIITHCNIPNSIEERNVAIIEDFVKIADEIPIEESKEIIKRFLERRWLYYLPNYHTKIQKVLILLVKKCVSHNFFPRKLIEYLLEIRDVDDRLNVSISKTQKNEYHVSIKNTNEFKIVKSVDDNSNLRIVDLTREERMERFTRYPLNNISFENFNSLIEFISSSDTLIKYSFTISQILYDVLRNIIKNLETIDSYYRALPYVIEMGRPISRLQYMGEVYISSSSREEKDASILLFNLLKKSLIMTGHTHQSRFSNIMSTISTEDPVIFRKLTLDIYCNFMNLFDDQINELIFSYLEDRDVFSSYYRFISKVYPSRPENIKKRYLHRISQIANGHFTNRIIKKLELYEPIHEHLPQIEKEWFLRNSENLNYSFRLGYKGRIDAISNTLIARSFNSIKEMIDELEKDPILYDLEPFYEIMKNNPHDVLDAIDDFKNIDEKYYPMIFHALSHALDSFEEIAWGKAINFILYLATEGNKDNKLELWSSIAWFLSCCIRRDKSSLLIYHKEISNVIQSIFSINRSKDSEDLRIQSSNGTLDGPDLYNFYVFNLIFAYDYWLVKHFEKRDLILILENAMSSGHEEKNIGFLTAAAYNFNNFAIFHPDKVGYIAQLIFGGEYSVPNHRNTIWMSYFQNNNLELHDKDYNLFFCYLSKYLEDSIEVFKKGGLFFNNELIEKITLFICGAFLKKCEKSETLFYNLIANISDDIKHHLIYVIGGWIRQNNIMKLDDERLKMIYEDDLFKGFSEFFEWFIHNPFEKKYAIDKLLALIDSENFDVKDSYLTIDSVINKLVEFVKIELDKVLAIILLIVKKYARNNLLVHIQNSCHSMLKEINQDHPVYRKICEIFHKHGFLEFM